MTGPVFLFVLAVLTVVLAPLVGGLLFGLDRKLTARLQGRVGPPLVQPFYDVLKLWHKEKIAVNRLHLVWAWAYLVLVIASLLLLVWQQDLLLLVFTLGFAAIALVMGSFSVRSPYSHFGGQRELMQLLAYEPVLLLTAVAVYFRTGTFLVSGILQQDRPLLFSLPLVFAALVIILTIKMRKSPFDLAACEHAHQELVRGIYTEYSGPYLALIQVAHWYELVLVLALIGLFWAHPWWAGVLLAVAAFFAELVVDNSTARVTWPVMLRLVWASCLTLVLANLAALYLIV
ncbi:MAG: NADH-quinone oxidoreductase subunit H [Clostridia bacterium]|nr:NADH-quinone oxidoreductase subunit H [Clostridia bacterium]